mgnify:CR=1 FL=1
MHYSLVKKLSSAAIAAGLFVPLVAMAQLENLQNLAERSLDIINVVLVIVFVLAILVFAWGVVKFITAAGSPDKVKEARGFIIWGIIGVFVLAAIFGLVQFIGSSLGISTEGGGELEPPAVVRPPSP